MTDWRALYPFKSNVLDSGGLRYHYIDEGTGPPIVMLHGNPTWSFYYRELVEALRDTHRCIVPDHIGCGLSDKPGDAQYSYTLSRRVVDLEYLLDHLNITENVSLVLHDWGGMIGMAAAVRRPERIARIVILNTAAFMPPNNKPLPWQLKLLRRKGTLSEFLVRGLNLFAWPATWMATVKGLAPEVKAGLLAPYDSWANRIATLRFVQDIPTGDGDPAYGVARQTDDGLQKLSAKPMLICWGMKDFVFDADYLAEWQRRFPNAQVHRFRNAGHYVLEDARDEVISLVRDLLAD